MRSANPRGQGARLREELLAAAERLLDEGGADAVLTLRGVAREAGVAAPSVYRHFPHLGELRAALTDRQLGDLREALDRARHRSRTAAPAERLHAVCRAYLRWGLDCPGRYPLVVRGGPQGPGAPHPLLQVLPDLLAGLDPPPPAPRAAAAAIWTGLHGVVSLRTADPGFAWPAAARQVDAVLAGALRPRAGDPPG